MDQTTEETQDILTPAPATQRTATFSPDRHYRYTLTRKWGPGNRMVNFIMLNPSTADEVDNDPTVERCERRAREWGYDGLIVTNLFALRSTDPAALRHNPNPEGQPENGEAIYSAAKAAALVICAWGNHGSYKRQSKFVREILISAGVTMHCLKMAKTGEPCHPLYLSYSLKPVEMVS